MRDYEWGLETEVILNVKPWIFRYEKESEQQTRQLQLYFLSAVYLHRHHNSFRQDQISDNKGGVYASIRRPHACSRMGKAGRRSTSYDGEA